MKGGVGCGGGGSFGGGGGVGVSHAVAPISSVCHPRVRVCSVRFV